MALPIEPFRLNSCQYRIFYSHKFRWPLFPNYDLPEAYGLARKSRSLQDQHLRALTFHIAGKTLNLKLETADNVTLGAWFVLSDSYYQTHRTASSLSASGPSLDLVRNAVQSRPTILFLHGTGGTRVTPSRMQFYTHATSRLDTNVLTIDYRGFGESTGVPSEDGLELDAYTAWKWVLEQGAKQGDVVVVGHSLGTNIATRLGKRLAHEGAKPRGVALLAPFSQLAVLLETYPILSLPILKPIMGFAVGRSTSRPVALQVCSNNADAVTSRTDQSSDSRAI